MSYRSEQIHEYKYEYLRQGKQELMKRANFTEDPTSNLDLNFS